MTGTDQKMSLDLSGEFTAREDEEGLPQIVRYTAVWKIGADGTERSSAELEDDEPGIKVIGGA